jgi:hypothetical protein
VGIAAEPAWTRASTVKLERGLMEAVSAADRTCGYLLIPDLDTDANAETYGRGHAGQPVLRVVKLRSR